MKKILCLDFDGVIHSYSSGWCGPRNIPDPPVEGALQWMLDALAAGYEVQVLSSRSRYLGGRWAMRRWLKKHALHFQWINWWDQGIWGRLLGSEVIGPSLRRVKFVKRKPPAFVSIDDRGLTFRGKFPDLATLEEFKPWNKKEAS